MKHFRLLFTTLLLLCAVSVSAHDFEVGGIYYNILSKSDKTVEVTFKGSTYSEYSNEYTGSVTIPQTVRYYGVTYKVTRIGENALLACRNLTSISIPNSVVSVGDGAFGSTAWYDNQPIGAVYVGKVLYKYKATISVDTNIVLEEGTLGIADHAFYKCENLTAITLPASLINIGESAFEGCKRLTSIDIPNSVASIGDYAFEGCSGLTSLTIGKNVNSIGMDAFGGCNKLQTVISLATAAPKLDGGNFSSIYASPELYYPYGSDYSSWTIFRTKKECLENAGVLYSILNNTNSTVQVIGADNIDKVTIAENIVIGEQSYLVTKITSNAFTDGVVSVEVPKTITAIEPLSLRLCNTLESIVIDEENQKYDTRDNCIAFIETATNTLVAGCKNSKIPNSVTCVGNKAFYGCLGLTTIDIPNSVSEIGAGAFEGCTGLTSVTIPASVNKLYCCTFCICI